MDLKTKTRLAVLECYKYDGLQAAINRVDELMVQCEHEKVDYRLRIDIKGELAEVILECVLSEVQKRLPMSIISKGLCIRNKHTQLTTEMDVTFFTPARIYMFECKSYSGKKTLTAECTLTNKTTSKDVYGQSMHHMEILNQYMLPFRRNRDIKGQAPFKMILFELSTTACEDKRIDRWKRVIPVMTPADLVPFFVEELKSVSKDNWDIPAMLPTLKQLDAMSAQLFKEHMERMNRIK